MDNVCSSTGRSRCKEAAEDDRLSSYLESIPDDVFINIASRLDLPSLMSLEVNKDLQYRVSQIYIVAGLH